MSIRCYIKQGLLEGKLQPECAFPLTILKFGGLYPTNPRETVHVLLNRESVQMAPSVKAQSVPAPQGLLKPSQGDETVLLPDLFVSFHAEEPRFHPGYQQVKQESEAWFAKYVVRNEAAA